MTNRRLPAAKQMPPSFFSSVMQAYVENNQMRFAPCEGGKRDTRSLSAREMADLRDGVISADAKVAQIRTRGEERVCVRMATKRNRKR